MVINNSVCIRRKYFIPVKVITFVFLAVLGVTVFKFSDENIIISIGSKQPNSPYRGIANESDQTQAKLAITYNEKKDFQKVFVSHYFPKTASIYRNYIPKEKFSQKILIITHLSTNLIDGLPQKIPLYTFTFSSMLYASWKYVLENYKWARNSARGNKVDILVYYSDKLTGHDLPVDCRELQKRRDLIFSKESICFKRPIPERNFSYVILNQFSFLKDAEIDKIISSYDYVMRTDPDTFFTPTFFSWKIPQSVEIIFGMGGYSSDFNRKLLDRIATEDFNWKREGLGSIGSTWIVKQNKFLELCSKAAFASHFVYQNCFKLSSKYPEILPYMESNPKDGTWPDWWRPVSSMYGGDLAVQCLFSNLSRPVNQPELALDAHSSFSAKFLDAKHIHAFHTAEKFNKFELFASLGSFCENGQLAEVYRQTRPLNLIGRFNSNMTISDYAGNISMHGAVNYFNWNGCF